MILYKCKCELLTSIDFQVCPGCGNKEDKVIVDTNDLDEVVYVLTMEDVESVINNDISDDLADNIQNVHRNVIKEVVKSKLEIPWFEYIEAVLESKFGGI